MSDATIAGWAAAGLMFISSISLSVVQIIKNGNSQAEWRGEMETRVEQGEKLHNACRTEMTEAIKGIDDKIGDLHERITKSQGAV